MSAVVIRWDELLKHAAARGAEACQAGGEVGVLARRYSRHPLLRRAFFDGWIEAAAARTDQLLRARKIAALTRAAEWLDCQERQP